MRETATGAGFGQHSNQLRVKRARFLPQSSEPILFPRLRNKYATSLTYIILVPDALHLGDLMLIWVRPAAKITMPPSDFQGKKKSVPDTTRGVVLNGGETPISGQPDSRGGSRPCKEKKTLPGTLTDVSEFFCVAALDDVSNSHRNDTSTQAGPNSVGMVGNINPIPFRSEGLPAPTQMLQIMRATQKRIRDPNDSVPSHRIA
ncbi:unnamed protein product [Rodentolepis nana]|uniref:Uncharacterized protein n=1 Tax=Rodentolepis nana TaxID=102285 RepID=A0A0R3T178_RODNA|nr:unnamed protein product [Rodentolepis nana]